jgi:hypothetical protein
VNLPAAARVPSIGHDEAAREAVLLGRHVRIEQYGSFTGPCPTDARAARTQLIEESLVVRALRTGVESNLDRDGRLLRVRRATSEEIGNHAEREDSLGAAAHPCCI